MTTLKTPAIGALLLIATLGLSACSGTESAGDEEPTETTAPAAAEGETDAGSETSADSAVEPEAAAPAPLVFDVLPTEPTEPGPHPLLAWDAVDGATTYDLIVLDAAGSPYWAWSGETTSVYLGGVENPDAVGAWTFEPLTWIVTARDSGGEPLAMSAQATLSP